MNDEIKEILEKLKENISIVSIEEEHLLLDYITNLQQENEKIRKMNMHEHKYGSEMEEKYLIEKAKIGKTMNKLKVKKARFINESDYIINDLDLDEIMLCLEKSDNNE